MNLQIFSLNFREIYVKATLLYVYIVLLYYNGNYFNISKKMYIFKYIILFKYHNSIPWTTNDVDND